MFISGSLTKIRSKLACKSLTFESMYSHLSNNRGGWNKRVGVQKLQIQLDFSVNFLIQNKDLQLKMTMRKIIIRFCKNIESCVIKSINVQGDFCLCRVEFSKIGMRDVTFIREMRVNKLYCQFYITSSNFQTVLLPFHILLA